MTTSYRLKLSRTESLNFRNIPVWLCDMAGVLSDNGYQVYLVGGAVRDLIWGLTPHDWDLATDALPDAVESLFPDSIPTGKKFGTITVVAGENRVEVTTLREDLGYHDGRHPAGIHYCRDVVKDLARRDFTINAMAVDMAGGDLIDPFYGRRDCYRRILKAVGDPQIRFQEDGLRMFRFYRFLATCPVNAEQKTARAVDPIYAQKVSMERIRDEFNKTVVGVRVKKALTGLKNSGLLQYAVPEFKPVIGFSQGRPHHLWEHIIKTAEAIAPTLELRLAALLHDIAKPQTVTWNESGIHFYGHDLQGSETAGNVLERLRYPAKIIEKVQTLIRHHMFNIPPEAGNAAFRRFIARVGPENVRDLLELRRADIIASGRMNRDTWEYWSSFSETMAFHLNDIQTAPLKPVVNGDAIREYLHLNPGPTIGAIMNHLGGLILDNPDLNQREILLDAAKKYLRQVSEENTE